VTCVGPGAPGAPLKDIVASIAASESRAVVKNIRAFNQMAATSATTKPA